MDHVSNDSSNSYVKILNQKQHSTDSGETHIMLTGFFGKKKLPEVIQQCNRHKLEDCVKHQMIPSKANIDNKILIGSVQHKKSKSYARIGSFQCFSGWSYTCAHMGILK